MTSLPQRVYLIGPSGSGKSTVAQHIARCAGYDVIDLDDQITQRIGMPISQFFERFGEPAFRAIEREILAQTATSTGTVIATGGGIVVDPGNWTVMRPGSAIIGLMAESDILVQRIQQQNQTGDDEHTVRPLLAGNALERMRAQLDKRRPLYQQADAVIATEGRTEGQVASQAVEIAQQLASGGYLPFRSLSTPADRSDILVSKNAIRNLPRLIETRWPSAKRLWIITDQNVAAEWLEPVRQLLADRPFTIESIVVPAGERSKSWESIRSLTTQLTNEGISRRDAIIALGGGVIGDLAGFVAAITLRGVSVVQVPTSLLAMVDSSVGGKTGINLPAGKNLVGAFYQPGLVIVDPQFLETLSAEEYHSGMAEVIKHSRIQPSTPFGGRSLADLLSQVSSLDPVPDEHIVDLLRLNIAIKHSVVEVDERESRLRMILNFGHTAGHAIEADGYHYRHGEAVGLGMLVASEIGRREGTIDETYGAAIRELLDKAGLPTTLEADIDSVINRMSADKKIVAGNLQWILPTADGVEIVNGVDPAIVRQALESVAGSKTARASS